MSTVSTTVSSTASALTIAPIPTSPTPKNPSIAPKHTQLDPKVSLVPFKKEKAFDKRKVESERVRTKYPDLIPVICERHSTNNNLPQSSRRKYLVPPDITMGQFKYVIRKRIQLLPDQALFVFVNETVMCPTMTTMAEAYREHMDEDGFLYMVYSGESTFG